VLVGMQRILVQRWKFSGFLGSCAFVFYEVTEHGAIAWVSTALLGGLGALMVVTIIEENSCIAV
jgi:hypothetical protein